MRKNMGIHCALSKHEILDISTKLASMHVTTPATKIMEQGPF